MGLKDLCRLCAKEHELSKDLLHESNKNILDLIRQYTQITVLESDNMPTKVCLDCEEKLISFQLFVLECYKVQDQLLDLYLQNLNCEGFGIKIEDKTVALPMPLIKTEVKDEITTNDVQAMFSDEIEPENVIDKYDDEEYYSNGDDAGVAVSDAEGNEDYWDNVTLATLKQAKTKDVREKDNTEDDIAKLNKALQCSNLKLKDIIKLQCDDCKLRFKYCKDLFKHRVRAHKGEPLVHCLCGAALTRRTVYTHLLDHKQGTNKQPRGEADDTKSPYVEFKCDLCGKMCSSWYTLKNHCVRVHRTLPFVKCKCGVVLKSKTVMYKHVQDHKERYDNPSVLSCDQCFKICKSEIALNKHKLRHVPKSDRKFYCQFCDKVCNTKDLLRSHEKCHIPIDERKKFKCDFCNLKFTTPSSVKSHQRIVHEKVKSYVCDLCGYACGTNGELRQHRAIHSDDKPFVCRQCPKRFKTYSNLKTHMDTHGDTSYPCYICNRILNSRRTLRKHLLVHEDKCCHVCSYCNKAFKRRQTLKVHMNTHTGDKPLSCKWCDERFSYASTLRSHRLRCHPDKMAQTTYNTYNHVNHIPAEEYIKRDLAAIGLTKNEVEAAIQ